ncbi:hypothetical protein SAMN05421786_10134 [Chryseobacterium ureilyticum]|uniref:Uncharacterized protein n=1 Tax=Chryseobacterium ureilyticum TaxID=373668 RepID=A0A1N7JT84_9FLAO|nr:hypothetical protein [Chryseobacterium ureilyticum]SIS52525.1 hypothetical protein SAMN05421786_10134 [Chryseobacterium ureilyticum]
MIFYSNRKFKIWAYTVSHSSLLLRSVMQYDDQEGYSEETSYNIDLEFSFVEYMDIKTIWDSISLSIVEKEKFGSYEGKIFEIESNKEKTYIVAYSVLIGTNKWGLDDRIFNCDMNLKHDEILVSFPYQ